MISIQPLFQARCDNRKVCTPITVNPISWINAAINPPAKYLSFHFFVDWKTTPPCVTGPLWHTRLVTAQTNHELVNASDADISAAFVLQNGVECLRDLTDFADTLCMRAEGMLLGEPNSEPLIENSPSWRVDLDDETMGQVIIERTTLREISGRIEQIRGGPANLGSKGLIYGTSAVECYLSHTHNIFPGDCDCLVLYDGRPMALLEMKKHTLTEPIGDNLASRYYPIPDGRKYDSLFALQSKIRQETGVLVPFAVVYYATKYTKFRIQIIENRQNSLHTIKDSGDLNYDGRVPEELGRRILEVIDL